MDTTATGTAPRRSSLTAEQQDLLRFLVEKRNAGFSGLFVYGRSSAEAVIIFTRPDQPAARDRCSTTASAADFQCLAELGAITLMPSAPRQVRGQVAQPGLDLVASDFRESEGHGGSINVGQMIHTMIGGTAQGAVAGDRATIDQTANDPAQLAAALEAAVREILAGNELREVLAEITELMQSPADEAAVTGRVRRIATRIVSAITTAETFARGAAAIARLFQLGRELLGSGGTG